MLQKPNYKKSDMLTAENTVIETIDLEPMPQITRNQFIDVTHVVLINLMTENMMVVYECDEYKIVCQIRDLSNGY